MANELTRKESNSPALRLFDEQVDSIASAATNGISVQRLRSCLQTAIIRQPAINECTPRSIMETVMLVAQSGCDASGHNNGVHFIPFKENGQLNLKAMFGYNALIDLIMRSGDVQAVDAHAVYAEDAEAGNFKVSLGTNPEIYHAPSGKADTSKRAVAYYAVAFTRGRPVIAVMDADEVDGIRRRSKQPNGKAWAPNDADQSNYNQMGIKTAVRRLAKKVVTNAQLARVIAANDELEGLASQHLNNRPSTRARMAGSLPSDFDATEVREELGGEQVIDTTATDADDIDAVMDAAQPIERDQ